MYKRKLTILICTLVIVGLLFAPFSLPARAVVGIDDALAGGLFLGFLSAMGLDFSFIGIDQSKESLVGIIQDLYNQYRLQHSLEQMALSVAWESLKNAIFSGGTIQIPNDSADDMAAFADFLVDQYTLTDDSSAVIQDMRSFFLGDGSPLNGNFCYWTSDSLPGRHLVYSDVRTTLYVDQVYTINEHEFLLQLSTRDQYGRVLILYIDEAEYTFISPAGSVNYPPASCTIFPSWSSVSQDGLNLNEQYGIYDVTYWDLLLYDSRGNQNWMIHNIPRSAFGTIEQSAVYLNASTLSIPSSSIPQLDGVYVRVPGITDVFGGSVAGAADQLLEAALDEDLEASYEITDEPPVYPTPDGPTILNVFTDQIGSFFDTIWHYVSDLVDYSTPFIIVWRDQLMGAFPFRLMLPLYASFVLALFLGLYKVFRGVH